MIGQWLADLTDEDGGPSASLRIDLEERGDCYVGHGYLFYPGTLLPGFRYPIRLPKTPPHRTTVNVTYLYPSGGVMTQAERNEIEAILTQAHGAPPPPSLDVEFSLAGEHLRVDWSADNDRSGSVSLARSDTSMASELNGRPDLRSWEQFRTWAVSQRPRDYIFRGQRNPSKLVSTFHRTWRKDLHTWINEDVGTLFGAVAERLNYPLQMGNLQHNMAIWSILQHHGYPTPMIDWTYSPFVAAYFAFQEAEECNDCAPRIFIFDRVRWNQRYGKAEFFVDAAPNQLVVAESMSVANPRHAPQQAILTVTNVADVEAFVRLREQEDGVTYLSVCDLQTKHRTQIMRELELMGITYGSLFPGLDGICRDIRDRLFSPPS